MDENDIEIIKKELSDYFSEDIRKIAIAIGKTLQDNLNEFGQLLSQKDNQINDLKNIIKELEKVKNKQEDEIFKIKADIKYIENELKKKQSSLDQNSSENTKTKQINNNISNDNLKLFNLGKIGSNFLKTKLSYNSGDKVIEDLNADDKTKFFYRVSSLNGYFDVFPIKNLEYKNLRYLESFFDIDIKNQGEIKVEKACRIAATSYGYYSFVSKGKIIV